MKKIFIIIFVVLWIVDLSAQDKGQPDSTKLIVQVYNFRDNFIVDSSGIDTNQRHIELFMEYEDFMMQPIDLGQTGTPSISPLFMQRHEYKDFMFLNAYADFLITSEDLNYYKTNKPYTDIRYLGGLKLREQMNLNVMHTQTIKGVNFGVKYDLFTSRDMSAESGNSSINKMNIWVHKEIKNYEFYVAYFSNKFKRPENGGIIDTPITNFNPLADPEFILNGANTQLKHRSWYLNHSYKLTKDIKIKHVANFSRVYRIYSENKPNAVFGDTKLSESETYDSVSVRSAYNSFAFCYNFKNTNYFVAITDNIENFYYFKGYLYSQKGELFSDNYLSLGIADLKLPIFSKVNLFADYHFTGRNKNDYRLKSEQVINLAGSDSIMQITFEEQLKKYTPDYFYSHYSGNFDEWDNNFDKINNLSFVGKLNFKKLHITIGNSAQMITNHLYFNTKAEPQQLNKKVFINTLWLSKSFYWGIFGSDINLFWQKNNQKSILNIPEYLASASVYLNFPLFKKATTLNFGFNVSYFSEFYKYSYRPTTGMFYSKNNLKTGNYPVLNLFFTAKVKTAIIIVRFDHSNDYLFAPYYSLVENYHVSGYYLRFGVRWWFRN